MNTSRWIFGIVVLAILIGSVVVLMHSSKATPTTNSNSSNGVASSTNADIPGNNLTLGQDSNPTLGAYLVAYNGMTLYTNTNDSAGVSNCTGTCATTWPPYTVTSTANLVAEYPISGAIGTLVRADGSIQVTYNAHPLYFYSGDSANGDINGRGQGGVWTLAKP
jgi:predicted lipoprotein with Yx(FWY)xxD motif